MRRGIDLSQAVQLPRGLKTTGRRSARVFNTAFSALDNAMQGIPGANISQQEIDGLLADGSGLTDAQKDMVTVLRRSIRRRRLRKGPMPR